MAEPANLALFKLSGAPQHYAWGGYEFIPRLLGIENKERRPFAELWLGAHPQAPSTALLNGNNAPLDELLDAHPELLGETVRRRFGRLPFLLKVLDARDMLSIQVHPSKAQAEAGFARENGAGVPLDSPRRSYKDDNHKPEVHVPLTDFWMLHGFRPEAEIRQMLSQTPELAPLQPLFAQGGVESLYRSIMTMPQPQVNELLEPLLRRLAANPSIDMDSPDHWALKAAQTFPLPGGHDRGIFSIYLLNLLHLEPGQGTFQDAGVPHAYLHGVTVELMANSDNVLRGGLTPKHIDVDELLKTVVFKGAEPTLLTGRRISEAEVVYPTPAPDFQLSEIRLEPGASTRVSSPGPSIFLLLEGDVEERSGVALACRQGEAFFCAAERPVALASKLGARLFRAGVPS